MTDHLRLEQVKKTYPMPGGTAVIVDNVDLEIRRGEFLSLIGHSGCGKSTILSMIAGLTKATSGTIFLGGKPIRGAGLDRGVVFQAPCLLPWLTALDNVRLSVDQTGAGTSTTVRRDRAMQALAQVGLADAATMKPASMSAGMRQRVALARALALTPGMLLLDEPFGMLDSITRAELQDLLLSMNEACPTTLLVTHDIDEALLLSDRIAVMTNGPAARIRTILTVPFGRPRDREQVRSHPQHHALRDRLLGYFEAA